MQLMFRSRRAVKAVRKILADTPDFREPDAWWPLGMDSDEFRRGALWSENWWRQQIEKALEAQS